jgi:hypothetical protein
MKITLEAKFVPQDCWVGLFWKTTYPACNSQFPVPPYLNVRRTTWYLCLLPCLPIIVTTERSLEGDR